jgi:gamma-glutamyltranspeptidase
MTVPTAVAIASESPYTLEAGKALAEIGGNAVDIAVGAALTASVSRVRGADVLPGRIRLHQHQISGK